MSLLTGYGPHTTAKHRILRGYLEAWLAIMGQRRGPGGRRETDLVLVDGFAGSGRYDSGEQGSPLVMLDAYAQHEHRDRIPQRLHVVCIEKESAFTEHLRAEVAERKDGESNAEVDIRHGLFADEFPNVLGELKERFSRVPPTFAFLDPFGLKDNSLELTSSLAVQAHCEVLAYLPTGFMARFESAKEYGPALDNLYGGREVWQPVQELDDHEERRLWLRDRFARVVQEQTGGRSLSFDIQPQGSSNIYSLVFSSQNRRGIQRMKAAMWKVDPASGQFFRGGLRQRQPESLFDAAQSQDDPLALHGGAGEPDYGELERLLKQRFGSERFSIEEVSDYTLYETVFRDDAHLKRPVLGRLERREGLEVLASSRKVSAAGSYPPKTQLRFPP